LQMCPADYYWRCVGKEGKPTLSYSVSVDHTRRIQHSTRSFFGARNDKTTSLFDPWLTGVHSGILPKSSVFYELMNADGTFSSETVAWLICDGGYHKWATMICPYGATSVRAERLWSEMLESVRKDVECVFGIMKSRFRILRHGMRIHYFHEIDAVWFTCCIMHNMLLEHDGYTDALNTEEAWESLDPEIAGGRAQLMLTRADAAAPPQHVTVLSQMPAATAGTVWLGPTAIFPALEMYNSMLLRQSASGQPGTPQVSVHPPNPARRVPAVSLPDGDNQDEPVTECFEEQSEPAFFARRKQLVQHYATRWAQGTVHWPRGVAKKRTTFALPAAAGPTLQGSSSDTFITPQSQASLLELDRLAAVQALLDLESLEALEALNSSQDTHLEV
jgi:hypothetical protein